MTVQDADNTPFGFSTTNKIIFEKEAFMHLHIIRPELRAKGIGTVCVEDSVKLYFEELKLEGLCCEPDAYNTAPNRALQKAGFKNLETHKAVPDPLNFHQTVNRWVIEKPL